MIPAPSTSIIRLTTRIELRKQHLAHLVIAGFESNQYWLAEVWQARLKLISHMKFRCRHALLNWWREREEVGGQSACAKSVILRVGIALHLKGRWEMHVSRYEESAELKANLTVKLSWSDIIE
ncbi:hypothetical protein OIU74_028294 [Salix koriyanagi]|uniref:Uncharacterized protein n=1 Tax=Salix koriyanagi TaxID=2511006 RepID=A0A9Q0VDH1_9ROSI|nr:hypothetical protein OIU74_028294 [Salix koriyanagi]